MKTGDKVVCIKSHSKGLVKRGEEFTILNTFKCNCGDLILNVGIRSFSLMGTYCNDCGMIISKEMVFTHKLFRKLEQYSLTVNEYKEESIEIEEPIEV